MIGIEQARRANESRPQRPPYESYAAIVATFVTGLAAVAAVVRRSGRPAPELRPMDIVALGLATFKAARSVSREKVGSFARAPFVEGEAYVGDGEEPAGDGLRRAIGELVTCTRCVGTWTAAGLGSLQLVSPRFGRLLVWTLDAAALNDFLQAGFSALTATGNRMEEEKDRARH